MGTERSTDIQYHFQWLKLPKNESRGSFKEFTDPDQLWTVPNNSVAVFKSPIEEPLPSLFLLECMYAASVVIVWGRDTENLEKHPNFLKGPTYDVGEAGVGRRLNNATHFSYPDPSPFFFTRDIF